MATDFVPTAMVMSKWLHRSFIDKIVSSRQSSRRCDFTDQELVLLALAYSPEDWLSTTNIGSFVIRNIRYYNVQSAKSLFAQTGFHPAGNNVTSLARRVERYLSTYGIPIHTKVDENNKRVYTMTAGAARAFVQQCYEKYITTRAHPNTKIASIIINRSACPFLDIPVEVRLKIYRLVLKVAGFRLVVGQKWLNAYDEKIPIWDFQTQTPLTMPPLSELLSLLSVNKQIYEEAMPEFYHENHFQFSNMVLMKDFLTNMGAERRRHMRNVSVGYYKLSAAAAGARLLTESDTIQKLTLIVSGSQDPAGHYTLDGSRRHFKTLGQVPGFTALSRLRGVQQLTFNPTLEHTVIDAFLRPLVTQPKPIKKIKGKSRKTSKKRKHGEI
ncbi:hypothetical protein E4T39_05222 [Aureobasidium subglaciale]|nr:hypothetical protein E4T39_05222 [Aureobasidium subglaciale]